MQKQPIMNVEELTAIDRGLAPFRDILYARRKKAESLLLSMCGGDLAGYSDWHLHYGLHLLEGQWIFREWLPNAVEVWLIGEFSQWKLLPEFKLTSIANGDWEGKFPVDSMAPGQQYRVYVRWNGGCGYRIPSAANVIGRSTQDISRRDVVFNAMVSGPVEYSWQNECPGLSGHAKIYEAHIGMAREQGGIGTFEEFRCNVLPRVAKAGYDAIQLMALAHHPYYASFGYHVSSFYALYDQFGTREEFCRLVDDAHGMGISIIMDLVHSHAANNVDEGLSLMDGTEWQFFHSGARGHHPAWGSRCFDYSKPQVLRFLLSNCRFWLEEYNIDGFRFDGITSMLYLNHGLGVGAWTYSEYFNDNVDEDALAYLTLANKLVHEVNPGALSIAEDVSGFPGLCVPLTAGGAGFDCRLAMGVTDLWFKLTDRDDSDWGMGELWYELSGKRPEERTISYVESHDQALVGGKTFAFTLAGSRMYDSMRTEDQSMEVDRMMAVHKMARLATFASSDRGYLNFMGNEFGHPEWIDFPNERNGWSFAHSRRQWSLADDKGLRFHFLADFDRAMLELDKDGIFDKSPQFLMCDEERKLLAFERRGLVFIFNFHHSRSYSELEIPALPGKYVLVLDTDRKDFGGFGRILFPQVFFTVSTVERNNVSHRLRVYLPARTALVLKLDN